MKRRYRMTVQKIGMPSWASWSTAVELTDEELEVEGRDAGDIHPAFCLFRVFFPDVLKRSLHDYEDQETDHQAESTQAGIPY